MAARADWRGAISFAGLFTAQVAAYGSLKPRRSVSSFKTLDPKFKQPIRAPYLDKEGQEVQRDATLKGVEKSPGQFVILGEKELEMIANVGRSKVVEVDRFAPVDTVRFDLTLERYDIVPDEKIAGSEQAFNIIWNYLRSSERAAIIQNWAPKANSRPSTLAITAGEGGMVGSVICYAHEVKDDAPLFIPQINEKAGAVIEGLLDEDMLQNFDLEAYRDGYTERREAAIQSALSGEPISVDEEVALPASDAPDLMAALEAKLAEMGDQKKKAPAKKAAKKTKVAA